MLHTTNISIFRMSIKQDLYRVDLSVGGLYYLHEKIKRKNKHSDHITVWKYGPELSNKEGIKDKQVDVIWMNPLNPFVVLQLLQDVDLFSTFWYKVITKDGNIGWLALDDEDIQLLHLCFREAEVPED